jgi:hypothetical protein
VIGAVMTNTAAHAAFLLALLMFMDSMKFSKHWKLLLIGSVVSAWISLMTYDSDIVIFALMCAWLSLNWRDVRESGIAVSFTAHFITSSAFCLGIYFTLRWLYVPSDWGRQLASISPTMGTATINLLMYLGALLLPVDTVLANKLVGTPLPPDIVGHKFFVVIVGGLSLFALVVIGFLAWPRLKSFGRFFNWKVVLFLVSGILAPLLPVLLFASHPSETYLYLSVAFYCMFLSYGLMKWLETRKSETKANVIYVTTVVVLIVLFSGASWFRNKRVFECGETARRILYGLPHELSRLNRLKLLFAEVPGEPTSRKYGEYGFRGLDTIGDGEKANRAITLALQAAYRNESLVGEVVKEQELLQRCKAVSETQLCVLVHWDGQIDLLASASSG